jgi:NADH:ubiquinone oxidoreductase subunit D
MKENFVKQIDHAKNFLLNFGPQHPAAHGVLRLILQLNGENCYASWNRILVYCIEELRN